MALPQMREIPLSNGGVALVDDSDYEHLSRWTWRRNEGGYAVRTVREGGKKVNRLMQTEILGHRVGFQIDHRNRARLDNQRGNLRWATPSQNRANAAQRRDAVHSRFKGVRYFADKPRTRPWKAEIRVDGRCLSLGYFATEEAAAKAYDSAAVRHFGEFARLNFGSDSSE